MKQRINNIVEMAKIVGSDECAVISLANDIAKAITRKEIDPLLSIAVCLQAYSVKESIFLNKLRVIYNLSDKDTKLYIKKAAHDNPNSIAARIIPKPVANNLASKQGVRFNA